MMDHSENTLRAAIKSLRDTVTPAVDPDDSQATEQLRLTIDFLEFLRTRIYDVHARHRYELRHQIEVAQALRSDAQLVSSRAATQLENALESALTVQSDADAHTMELRSASQELWGSVRGVVREAREAADDVRQRISLSVLQGVQPLVEMESAWYLPFGFEPDPSSVAALDELLAREPDAVA
jgi:hypothetical protein